MLILEEGGGKILYQSKKKKDLHRIRIKVRSWSNNEKEYLAIDNRKRIRNCLK
jgi:hypothetical protein